MKLAHAHDSVKKNLVLAIGPSLKKVSFILIKFSYCRFFTLKHSPCSYVFDGENGVLAHAFFPESGDVHFDDDETFTDGVATGKNLFSVALHEIGHLLGLKHSVKSDAIMHGTYKPYKQNMTLTDDERLGINFIYGK